MLNQNNIIFKLSSDRRKSFRLYNVNNENVPIVMIHYLIIKYIKSFILLIK
jgi:hypothetical protein